MLGFTKKNKIITDQAKINELVTRGVEDVFIKENLLKQLQSGKQLRIKLGIDPTSKNIHIGRAITLRKLRAFQDLGHKVVLIVGDFTAQIGDASDKLEKRPMLSPAAIKENLKDYTTIMSKIVDVSKAEIVFNSQWLSKLTFKDVCELAETFTVQQMSNRRNFKERFDKEEEVSLREFMYPLMQGYDSVMVKADIEIGGFDQLFNLKAGRIIQKHYNMPEQDILTTAMLEGTDGRKMSSSWGNVININDIPQDMFGKVMSVKDELIPKYFLLCTDVSETEIENIKKEMQSGANPRDAKIRLAEEIVTLYHGKEAATKARNDFENTFAKGGVPEDIKEVKVEKGSVLVDVLLSEKIIESKSEFRRLVNEGAVTRIENGEKITDDRYSINEPTTLKIGKRRFIKITI